MPEPVELAMLSATRHGPSRGSVYFDRSKGLYYAAVSVPGQRQRKSRGFLIAAQALAELQTMRAGLTPAASAPGAPRLIDYATRWVDARRVLGHIRSTTAETYSHVCRVHIGRDPIMVSVDASGKSYRAPIAP